MSFELLRWTILKYTHHRYIQVEPKYLSLAWKNDENLKNRTVDITASVLMELMTLHMIVNEIQNIRVKEVE
jgi:hypothetical protein